MDMLKEILDEAKARAGFKSDRQLSLALGQSGSAVSNYRQGISKPDNFACAHLASLTGRELTEIIGLIEAQRATNNAKKEYWQDFMKRIGGTAASLSFLMIDAAPRTAESLIYSAQCILCKIALKVRLLSFKPIYVT